MKARILIVDDHRELRSALRTILEYHGYDCEEASEGLTALKEIQNRHFDLVLTDYRMPLMDGVQLLQTLSLKPDIPSVPVIMMTGIGDNNVKAKALNAGAVAFFTKPLNFETLLESIKHVISTRQRLHTPPRGGMN